VAALVAALTAEGTVSCESGKMGCWCPPPPPPQSAPCSSAQTRPRVRVPFSAPAAGERPHHAPPGHPLPAGTEGSVGTAGARRRSQQNEGSPPAAGVRAHHVPGHHIQDRAAGDGGGSEPGGHGGWGRRRARLCCRGVRRPAGQLACKTLPPKFHQVCLFCVCVQCNGRLPAGAPSRCTAQPPPTIDQQLEHAEAAPRSQAFWGLQSPSIHTCTHPSLAHRCPPRAWLSW